MRELKFKKTCKCIKAVAVCAVIATVLTILVLLNKEETNDPILPKETIYCEKTTTPHYCTCNGETHPLLIDGDSVKFGNKTFNSAEIERL